MKTFREKTGILFAVLVLAFTLTAGCASHSSKKTTTTTTAPAGQTTVVENESETVSEGHHHGVIGGVFHVVGEVLAFPFEVIAGLFRFIF